MIDRLHAGARRLLLFVGLMGAAAAGATQIAVGDPYLQLYNVANNSLGFTTGQLIRFGALDVDPNGNAGTTGFATTTNLQTGQAVSRTIAFNPGPFLPNFFSRVIAYDPALTGPWTINFRNPNFDPYAKTLSLPAGATQTPFVNSITLTGTALNPTFSWTPPAGATVNGYRINIFDKSLVNQNPANGPINNGQVASVGLQPGTTTHTVTAADFTVPGNPFTAGKHYSIEISILQTRDGSSTNLSTSNVFSLSRVYADFTPLASANLPAVNLPVTLANGSFQFNITVQPGQTYYIDPDIATGYDYAIGAGDPNFASVVLPDLQNTPYLVSWLEAGIMTSAQVLAGQVFDFPVGGVAGFSVTGIDPALGLDPSNATAFITGLTFAAAGFFTGTQTPIVTAAAVPEPGTVALMFAGLAAAFGRRRSRARPSAGASVAC